MQKNELKDKKKTWYEQLKTALDEIFERKNAKKDKK